MSEENVEFQRQGYEAWDRGDRESWLAFFDPDAEFVMPGLQSLEGTGPLHGKEGAHRLWDAWHETFPDAHFHVEEIRDLGDRTLARVRVAGHGALSEAPLDQSVWHLAEFRNHKVIRLVAFRSEADALEAAGRSE